MKARIAKKISRPNTGKRYTKGQRDQALCTLGARIGRGCPRWADDATGPRFGERMTRLHKAVKRAVAKGRRSA